MATYRFENQNPEPLVQILYKITQSRTHSTIYASGKDIDFSSHNLQANYPVTWIIYDTEFEQLSLNLSEERIKFDKCSFENLTININKKSNLSFTNKCKINIELNISSSENTSSILIDDSYIMSLMLDDLVGLSKLEITSNSTVDLLFIRGIKRRAIHNLNIQSGSLIKKTSISNYTIEYLNLNQATLSNVKFENVHFSSSIDITSLSQSKIYFRNSLIIDEFESFNINTSTNLFLEFYNLVVSENGIIFSFRNNELCEIIFKHCFINSHIKFITPAEFNLPNIYTYDSVFKELVIFERTNPTNLQFYNTIFQNGILIPLDLPKKIKVKSIVKTHSSVWCILKNQALEKNDKITALTYRKYEMLSFTEELKWSRDNISEKFVLYLNRFSNNHGLSWIRGIEFTLIVWLLFYSLYSWASNGFIITKGLETLIFTQKEFWADAINFLWLPQGLLELTKGLLKSTNGFYFAIMIISFIFGKVFIAYGIYQLVAAFRKHGKV